MQYCKDNFLELNVLKTKEMVIDYRKAKNIRNNKIIEFMNNKIEQVSNYTYLGVIFNDTLSWGDHIDSLMKKINSRFYCMRKMNSFKVRQEIMSIFYNSVICGVWT